MKIFNKYKFSDKSQSLGGVISTIMGLASIACLLWAIFISFKASGHAGMQVGTLGLMSLILSAIGTIIGLLSFKEADKFYTFPKVGSIMCGIMTVAMIFIFLMGTDI